MLLVCLCLTTYFAYHAVQGRHGLDARSKLLVRSATLERELSALGSVQARLEREIALLSEADPDPDLVDELSRAMLGFARPGDRLLMRISRTTQRR